MKLRDEQAMKKMIKVLLFLAFVLLLYEIGKCMQLHKIFYINTTASEPIGIYLVKEGEIRKGDLVVFKVPENAESIIYGRKFLQPPALLLKEVYALPGERYKITDIYIYVNGCQVGRVYEKDSRGMLLPKLRGDFTVREDHFLTLATYKETSLDSRYFGDIAKELIVAKVIPLLTLPEFLE